MMNKMLVLQWSESEFGDFEEVINLEDALIEAIPPEMAELDGHDMGAGEVNIFILTDDPQATFLRALDVVRNVGKIYKFRAAFRPTDGNAYNVVWPEGLKNFSVS